MLASLAKNVYKWNENVSYKNNIFTHTGQYFFGQKIVAS